MRDTHRASNEAPSTGAPHVVRDRILRSIRDAEPAILVVVAPGGWGKSRLLEDWARTRNGPVARLTLDARHEDPDLLLSDFAAACARVLGCDPAIWREHAEPDGRSADTRLRALVGRLPAASAVTVDDVHTLHSPSSVLGALVQLARERTLEVALASREVPECVRARDLVHGTALRVEPRALAMDRDEIALFFADTAMAGDAAFLDHAERHTRGWAAGLRLLHHGVMQGRAASAFDADGATIGAYFDAEILVHLDGATRAALADAALLHDVTHESCRVIGAAHAWSCLESLAQDGLFVTRDGDALRLHPMLHEHLRRATASDHPDRAAAAFLRLARWHRVAQRATEALEASLEGMALARAASPDRVTKLAAEAAHCLECAIPGLVQTARRDRVLAAADRIPEEQRNARPYLAALLAWLRNDHDSIPQAAADSPQTMCMVRILDAAAALRTMQLDRLADAALAARAALPPDDAFLRNLIVSILQAAFRFTGDPRAGHAAQAEAARLAEDVRRPVDAVQAGAMLGILCIMHGRLHAAEAALTRALAIADERLDPDAPMRGLAHQFLGYVFYEWNRLDEAARELEHARAIAEPVGHRGILTGVLRVLAVVRLRTGDGAAAGEDMAALEALMPPAQTDARNREWLDGTRAALAVAAGDQSELRGWIARCGYVPAEIAASPELALHARLQEFTTLARALVLLGRFDDAALLAGRIEAAAAAAGRTGFRVAAAAALAAAREAQDRRDDADEALARALCAAWPESMVRTFADTPGPLVAVLARARPNGVPLAFLETVRHCAGGGAAPAGLTDRERAALVLLAGGRSNKSLARAMGVSVSTVKTHLHHAFRKLGARSRTHALVRARELGVLDAAGEAHASPR